VTASAPRPELERPSIVGGPWKASSLVALAGVEAATVALVIACWYGASTRATPEQQMPWMNAAAIAAVLAFALQAGWLVAGQRAVARRGYTLRQSAAQVLAPRDLPTATAPAEAVVPCHEFVSGAGMTRFHRPGCVLAQGRETRVVRTAQIRRQRLLPCPMCRPDAEPSAG
jgi:hypothetical protein